MHAEQSTQPRNYEGNWTRFLKVPTCSANFAIRPSKEDYLTRSGMKIFEKHLSQPEAPHLDLNPLTNDLIREGSYDAELKVSDRSETKDEPVNIELPGSLDEMTSLESNKRDLKAFKD